MTPRGIHDRRSLIVLPTIGGFLFVLYPSLAASFNGAGPNFYALHISASPARPRIFTVEAAHQDGGRDGGS